jgi:hypothetical protein
MGMARFQRGCYYMLPPNNFSDIVDLEEDILVKRFLIVVFLISLFQSISFAISVDPRLKTFRDLSEEMTGIRTGVYFEKYEQNFVMTKEYDELTKLDLEKFYAPPKNNFDIIVVGPWCVGKNVRKVYNIFTEISSTSVSENNKKLFEVLNRLKSFLKIKNYEYLKINSEEDSYSCGIENLYHINIGINNKKLKVYVWFIDDDVMQQAVEYRKSVDKKSIP